MYSDRKKLYKSIYNIRKRPLIVYVTSIRPKLSCQMAGDSIAPIIEQINNIPIKSKEIDFLIISNGGDPITSLRIIGLLRERFEHISVLLPYVAYSAATILSLGADEIIMHPFSNLGPVDPQLTVTRQNGHGQQEQLQFSSEDLRNFIDFIKSDVGISDQQHLISAISPLINDVGSLPIGSAKRGQQLSLTLSEKMLSTPIQDKNKAKAISKALNTSYYHHGYAVSRKEAFDMGLNIVYPDKKLEDLMWKIWLDISAEMKCENTFDVIKEIMEDPQASAMINQIPVVNLPAGTPPHIAQQIIVNHANNVPVTTRSALKKKAFMASVESTYFAKSVYNNIDILFWRNPDMSLAANLTLSSSGWIDYSEV